MEDFTIVGLEAFPGEPFPAELNGWTGSMEVASPADYVSPGGMMVFAADGVPDTERSCAYKIWVAQGSPPNAVQVTQDHLEAAKGDIAIVISIMAILSVLSHCTTANGAVPNCVTRASDGITIAQFNNHPGMVHTLPVTRRLREWLVAAPQRLDRYTSCSRMVLLMMIANALHRYSNQNHNWFTGKTGDVKTTTHKALAVAGAEKAMLQAFAAAKGHDCWHFLSTTTLNDFVAIITGEDEAVINDNFMYNTANVGGEFVHRVLDVGEAARDRWPVGTLGISAIILGMELVESMFTSIISKIRVANIDDVLNNIRVCRQMLKTQVLTRPALLHLRTALHDIIAAAVGYAAASPKTSAIVENHPALAQFAENNLTAKNNGDTLYRRVIESESDPAAVATFLQAMFAGGRNALINAFLPEGLDDADARAELGNAPQVGITLLKSAAEKRDMGNAVAAMQAMAAAGIDAAQIDAAMATVV